MYLILKEVSLISNEKSLQLNIVDLGLDDDGGNDDDDGGNDDDDCCGGLKLAGLVCCEFAEKPEELRGKGIFSDKFCIGGILDCVAHNLSNLLSIVSKCSFILRNLESRAPI